MCGCIITLLCLVCGWGWIFGILGYGRVQVMLLQWYDWGDMIVAPNPCKMHRTFYWSNSTRIDCMRVFELVRKKNPPWVLQLSKNFTFHKYEYIVHHLLLLIVLQYNFIYCTSKSSGNNLMQGKKCNKWAIYFPLGPRMMLHTTLLIVTAAPLLKYNMHFLPS